MENNFNELTLNEMHKINGGFKWRELAGNMISGGILGAVYAEKLGTKNRVDYAIKGAIGAGFVYVCNDLISNL
jgi:hypothetical protein